MKRLNTVAKYWQTKGSEKKESERYLKHCAQHFGDPVKWLKPRLYPAMPWCGTHPERSERLAEHGANWRTDTSVSATP